MPYGVRGYLVPLGFDDAIGDLVQSFWSDSGLVTHSVRCQDI